MMPNVPSSSSAGVLPAAKASPLLNRHLGRPARTMGLFAGLCFLPVLLAIASGGCVSKSKAEAKTRAAYIAGQQEAIARMQRAQGPSVTINGEVRNHVVPWTNGMTVTQALIAAEYIGAKDPGQVIVVHNGVATRLDPKRLLSGVDVPLQPGDIVQLMPQAAPPNQ
jgi:hypothetical protein